MSNRQKVKGNSYERELVRKLQSLGYEAERARGSDGRALGEAEDVDLRFRLEGSRGGYWLVQAKRRAAIADYIKPGKDVDIVMMRQDRGEDLVVLTLDKFLSLL